ncbi:helix-turn-helix domain-containing protein [Streptomyces sp. NPDC020794]|uniref:helix-turn-helix domain-containing protein n=1 Tax=unclassified Streptomyces TaxID=2593676 RepID=UPI0036E849F9
MRAQVVLHAARGRSNARIARETGLHVDTVRCWRRRFAERGLAGLTDRKRSGRPPAFTPLQTAQVKALACQLPAETGVPSARWSCPEPAREAMQRGIAPFVSASTVRRWLANDALKPWQHRSWISITDPDFRPKAQRVLDLYARTWQGRPLGADEYVISADEKTSTYTSPCRPAPWTLRLQTERLRSIQQVRHSRLRSDRRAPGYGRPGVVTGRGGRADCRGLVSGRRRGRSSAGRWSTRRARRA